MNKKVKIKICGISRLEDIEIVNEAMPDYIGFVFAQSRRKVTPQQAVKLKEKLNPEITPIGVFVDENINTILSLVEQEIIEMIQLHGDENEEYIKKLKTLTNRPIIKALATPSNKDTEFWQKSQTDYLLFDSKQAGSGKTFDWDIIETVKINKPFFLAGGLDIDNIKPAIDKIRPFAIDISSGVETDGLKDREKIISIVRAIKYGK